MSAITGILDTTLSGVGQPVWTGRRIMPDLLWFQRARQRRALAELDDRQLDDIGISREQAQREAAKRFWQK
ncbi:DUF1127 domain-containing protein [Thiosocius teredinicola]|uniref:DUF1127 domain-containing protein n=1 Tax=Thiosocius teredinicola TaxID=1973002 RepID=UPI0013DE4FEB